MGGRLKVIAMVGLLLVAQAMRVPADATALVYVKDCEAPGTLGNNVDTFQTYVPRSAGTFKGVLSNVIVRNPTLCTGPSTNIESWSYLVSFNNPDLTQFGFAKCGPANQTCSFDTNRTGEVRFVFALNDGILRDAGGLGDLPIKPTLNHQYRFRIDIAPGDCSNNRCFYFRVLNRTAGETSYRYFTRSAPNSTSQSIWWGTEVHYSSSAMGVRANAPQLFVEDMEYLPSQNTVWQRVDNQTSPPNERSSATPPLSFPSYWEGKMENGPYPPLDRMQVLTHAH